jgi:putative membrane protein
MWLFLGLFALCFALFHWVVERLPALKRRFISRREIDEEVEEAAINAFFRQGLYRTRDANGVLLFISVFEHKVWLLADRGIHEKVPQAEWDALVAKPSGAFVRGTARMPSAAPSRPSPSVSKPTFPSNRTTPTS